MAYVQTPTSGRRTATLIAVGALHAALGYALITGFAATVWDKVDVYMPTTEYRDDPPPPPEPVPEPSQAPDLKVFAPPPPLPLPRREDTTTVELTPIPQPPALPSASPGTGAGLLPLPSPVPSLVSPKAPMPLGSPGRWATSEDYPAAELRREIEGTARFRVTVGADGRVRNCEIVSSSGSPGLDRATCENVSRRARFKPATDETGAAVSGSYSNAIRWEIPQ